VGDIAGLGSLGRWELNLRPEVRVREPLEKLGGAPFGNPSCPVDDEVLNKAAFVVAARLEREDNPRVVADIANLEALSQMSGDDLVTIEADPDNRHLGLPSRPKVTRCASAEDSSTARTLSGIVFMRNDTWGRPVVAAT
jgi:hypothetical protein